MNKSDIMKAAEEAAEWIKTKPAEGMSWHMGSEIWYLNAPSREGMAEMLCKAAELLKQVEWQPIESAPKDGAEILICEADKYIHIGMWYDDGVYKYWMSDDCHEIDCPSAWQPLPQPPVIIEKEGV